MYVANATKNLLELTESLGLAFVKLIVNFANRISFHQVACSNQSYAIYEALEDLRAVFQQSSLTEK